MGSVPFAEASHQAILFSTEVWGSGEDGEGQGLVLNFKVEHGVLLPTAKTSRKHFSIHTAPGRVVRESR